MSTVLLRVTFDPMTKIDPLTVAGGDFHMTVARYLGRVTSQPVQVDYAETFMTGAAFAGGRLLATFEVAEIGGAR
jgi:hypothetical protein